MGIGDTRELLRAGDVSVVDHVGSALASVREAEPDLGAFVSLAEASALRSAEACDAHLRTFGAAAWHDRPLLGVPIAVKDLIQTEDLPTTRGSLLENRRPVRDAPAVARVRAAGAIVIGKTTTSEHGWSASTVNRLGPPARNPWDRSRSAGGSSGGSAAAVAARLCTAALGTDGAGSIRIPAAFCGVVGYKPTFGRIPYVPACADRLAHLGPIATSVSDVTTLLDVMAGHHAQDPDSAIPPPARRWGESPLRIGWIEFPGTSSEVRRVSEEVLPVLEAHGHRIERIDVPFTDPYEALVDIIAATEAAGFVSTDEPWCDQGRLAIVRHGRTVSGAQVMQAEAARLALRTTMEAVMGRYDVLAMATVPTEPFDLDAIAPSWAADPKDLRWLAWSPASYPFNMTGQPALSLPVGVTAAGLPVGVQLVGPVGEDLLVLATAGRVERDLGVLPAPAGLVTEGLM